MINEIIEVAVTTGAWVPVTLGASQACNSFLVQARAGNEFKISADAAGTTYFTVKSGLSLDKFSTKGSILFYARMVSVGDTLEVFTA
jgi:hypothetical protein